MANRRLKDIPPSGGAPAAPATRASRAATPADAVPAGVVSANALHDRIEVLTRELNQAREQAAQFREIAELATDIISRHAPDGVCTYVSPSSARVMGYAPDEIIGSALADKIHPDDLPAFSVEMARLRGGGESSTVRFRFFSKRHNDYVWFEANLRSIRDQHGVLEGFHSIAREITARKRNEDALAESEARFRLLAEHASDIISRTRPEGEIIYVSPSVHALLGYAPEELVGTLAQDLIEPDDVPGAVEARAALLATGESSPVIHRLRRRDGQSVWVETTRRPVVDPTTGEVIEIHAVSRDVSARIQAERELSELAAMKSDFVALVSHELRAPLTNMMGSVELLQHEASNVPESARRALAVLAAQMERLRQLVETILDVSRLDAGQLPLNIGPAPVDIAVARALETLPASDAASIEVDVAPSMPFAWADETYLAQVIANLLSNALKYGEPPVRLAASSNGDHLVITVTDTGHGVSAADQERLFEPFFRSSHGASSASGYGLGLYFARRLLEAQGGTISVESPVPVHLDARVGIRDQPGARFTVRIPAARVPAPCDGPRGSQ
jgi:PAS domain S-box-containing protein